MKLLAELDGVPLIARTIDSLLRAGADRVIVVAARTETFVSVELIQDPRVATTINVEPDRGMFSSIQTGMALLDADVVLVLPADMPVVQSATIRAVADRARVVGRPVVPAFGAQRGHPIAIPGGFCRALCGTDPTLSLKAALQIVGADVLELAVDDPGVLKDVDVPADLPSVSGET
jgi:molybdenum cofactor cytidylyltransferase